MSQSEKVRLGDVLFQGIDENDYLNELYKNILYNYAMEAIFNNKAFDLTNCGESVRNLYGRYTDITEVFPADINDDMLLHLDNIKQFFVRLFCKYGILREN